MNLKFTAKMEPECKDFLKIRDASSDYMTIDTFIQRHPDISEKELNECYIKYRGKEQTYKENTEEYWAFSEKMKLIHYTPPIMVVQPFIKPSIYFMQKAIECLGFARFFTMKSALLLDTDYNIRWSQGYIPQYLFRCIYFGTASTWYSNAFDHVLQAVYWGKELYTSVVDRDGNPYDEGWDTKKTLSLCTYEFVVGELKNRNETKARKLLTSCSAKIEEVRKWANYIKHKGGIDYSYLEAENPFKFYVIPTSSISSTSMKNGAQYQPPAEKYEIKDFKSPIKIDIDDKMQELVKAYDAIFECIEKMIAEMDYDQYAIKIGGNS